MNDEHSKREFCIVFSDYPQPDELENLSRDELLAIVAEIASAARNVGFLGPIVAPDAEPNCLARFIGAELDLRYPDAPAGHRHGMFDADELLRGWASEDVSSIFSNSGKHEDDEYTEHMSSRGGKK